MKRILFAMVAGLLAGFTPVTSLAIDKPMHDAVAELDLDGDMVLYMNTSTIEKRILDYIDNMSAVILSSAGGAAPGPEFQAVTEGVEKVKTAIEWSGLLSLESYAMSMAPVEGTLCRSISVVSYAEADANKPMWRIAASEPRILKGIQYAPADAVLTINSTASIDEIWKVVNEAVATFLPPEQAMAFSQQTAMAEMLIGTNITAITGSLDNEILISLQLSEQKQCALPMGAQAVSIPEPSLIIGLQTKSPLLGQILLQKLEAAGMPVNSSPAGNHTCHILQLPIPAPFPVAPTLIQTEDYLLIGTNPEIILAALASKEQGTGLVSTPLYKKLLADAPEKTSGIEFMSPRFMQTYIGVFEQSMGSDMGPQGPVMMDLMFGRFKNIYSGSYMLKTPTGLYSRGYGDYGGAQVAEMAATSYVGVLAAIGIPSFQKARNNSMEKVCENNLRILDAAKEQWALENAKMDGEQPVEAEIGEYIKGGFGALQCPKGGTYTIGPVGTPPACSHAQPVPSALQNRAMTTEAQTGCSVISVALRLHWVEHGNFDGINSPIDLEAIQPSDLDGTYFNYASYSIDSLTDGNNYCISAQGIDKAAGMNVTMTVNGGESVWSIEPNED